MKYYGKFFSGLNMHITSSVSSTKLLIISVIMLLLNDVFAGNVIRDTRLAFAASENQIILQNWQQPTVILHSNMAVEIGNPAIVEPGQEYPSLLVYPSADGNLNAKVFRKSGVIRKVDDPAVQTLSREVNSGKEVTITFEGNPEPGRYRIDLTLNDLQGGELLDSYYFSVFNAGDIPPDQSTIVHTGEDGRLIYIPDYRGNRIPDFSHVGYKGGGVPIPDAQIEIILEPQPGDDTERIQEAIDEIAKLPLDNDGFRGALLLKNGIYEIGESLHIGHSGIVIRGEGQGDFRDFWLDPNEGHSLEELKQHIEGKPATVLIATGQSMRTLITVQGASGVDIDNNSFKEIIDQYVPVGAYSFKIKDTRYIELLSPSESEMVSRQPEFEWQIKPSFEVGDKIIVERSGNMEWINEIKMNQIPPRSDGGTINQWAPFNLQFENIVTKIYGNRIWLKYPIMNAIEKRWGGGRIYTYDDSRRISQVGIENLRSISYWKPNENGVDDTRHADRFLNFDNVENAWVLNVTVEHFYSTNGSFSTGRGSKGTTFKNSSTLVADRSFYAGPGYDSSGRTYEPTGVYVGRYGWRLQGQGALVMDAYAINSRHAYSLGSRVTGPNVFFDAVAEQSLTWSEPHHRWAAGGLFDNIEESHGIALMNRLNYGTGHGWAGANFAAWNTSGGRLVTEQPPTAQNWAIGHTGTKSPGPFHNWNLDNYGYSFGYWESLGSHIKPTSLYLQQLKDRLGQESLYNIGYQDF